MSWWNGRELRIRLRRSPATGSRGASARGGRERCKLTFEEALRRPVGPTKEIVGPSRRSRRERLTREAVRGGTTPWLWPHPHLVQVQRYPRSRGNDYLEWSWSRGGSLAGPTSTAEAGSSQEAAPPSQVAPGLRRGAGGRPSRRQSLEHLFDRAGKRQVPIGLARGAG